MTFRKYFHSKKRIRLALALLLLTVPSISEAYYHDPVTDASPSVRALQEMRKQIDSIREAHGNLRDARNNAVQAENSLTEAKQSVITSEKDEKRAEKDLADARSALSSAEKGLSEAKARSAHAEILLENARENLEKQQQETAEKEAALRNIETILDTRESGASGSSRAEAVRRAVEEVNFQQNRMEEAIRLAGLYSAGLPSDASPEEAEKALRAMEQKKSEAGAAYEGTKQAYEQAASLLPSLQASYRDAVKERSDSLSAQADTQKWYDDTVAWVREGENNLTRAKENIISSKNWVIEAEKSLDNSLSARKLIAENVWDMGNGESFGTSMTYRHWKNGPYSGHQLYHSISWYQAFHRDEYPGEEKVSDEDWPKGNSHKGFELGLEAGRLESDTGARHGKSSGFTDTTLYVRYHNDHPVNSLRYGMILVLPTGENKYDQNAYVPKGLGLFQDFGGGWQIQPEIEAIHRLSEEDRISAKLSYDIKGSYAYSKEDPGFKVAPGNETRLDISYEHSEKNRQYKVWISHTNKQKTWQDISYGNISRRIRYTDGDAWEIGAAGNWQIRPKDELGAYILYGYTGDTEGEMKTDSLSEKEILLSYTHNIREDLSWQTWLSWYHSTLNYDPLYRSESIQDGWARKGIGFRMDWQQSPDNRWSIALERYIRTQKSAPDAQGYGLSLWYARIL